MKNIIFFIALIFSGIVPEITAQDATYERLVHVWMTRDGDSYMVSDYIDQADTTKGYLPYSKSYAVRLFGLECPENYNKYVGAKQPYSTEAGAAVRELMTGNRVKLDSVTTQCFDDGKCRMVVRVLLSDGTDLGKIVAAQGLGWSSFPDYPKNPPALLKNYRKEIEDLQRFARQNRRGLFSLPRRTWLHPDTWKKRHPGGGA